MNNNMEAKKLRNACKNINVNEEYNCALRTKSYADLFIKAQSLVNKPLSPSCSHQRFPEFLLEPGQETIAHILELGIFSNKSDLKALILDYFHISADASKICSHLLQNINQLQSNHFMFFQRIIDIVDNYSDLHAQFGSIISELHSLAFFSNPFSNLGEQDFKFIREKYSMVLHHMKSKRKKVARKIKMINLFNKATGICATAACGLLAMTAIVLAAHTLSALIVMGPAILSLPIQPLKTKILNLKFMRIGFLKKVGEQLDIAAKGTYILYRDFDTMSRLVSGLHDEIEHNKGMLQLCLERREEKFSMQVLRELKKSAVGFSKQIEELEEHVYLCLVTINRARALVIKKISIKFNI